MASKKTKFLVGLFISGGAILALVAFIFLGVTRFFETGKYYSVYFNESVQGLTKDSPVKYRGVSVGRVDDVKVAPDSKLVEVVLKIESGQVLDESIVAQLSPVGITGSMFIELDQKKEGEPDRSPKITFPTDHPIVASKPSEISNILRGIDEVLTRIKSLDLERLPGKMEKALDSLNQAIVEADVTGISKDIRGSLQRINQLFADKKWDMIVTDLKETTQSLKDAMARTDRMALKAQQILERVDGIVGEAEMPIRTALEDFEKAMGRADLLMERGGELVAGTEDRLAQLHQYLVGTGQNLERASEDLSRLMELLSDQPSLLLFGSPPAAREGSSQGSRP